MIFPDLKTDSKQQKIKELIAISCNFLQERPNFKT